MVRLRRCHQALPLGQLPVKEVAPMEQFLLNLLANLAADVLAALIVRKWIK